MSIRVTHFSDVLCVWAYVSQIRIDELGSEFGAQVEIDYRLVSVFGDVRRKMETQWGARGGVAAYGKHVLEVAAKFDHVTVHPEIWVAVAPPSSMPAHLYLCAVRLAEAEAKVPAGSWAKLAWRIRTAFFAELRNVAELEVLRGLAEAAGFPVAVLEAKLASGEAHAALADDLDQVSKLAVRSSPTMIFNEDRQRLTGNVGYRIIEANVRELLEKPASQHSWC